tara:strand:- start:160 stop:357 length:198 start_codon:yes stop_codon:yes gene_type:complete
MTDGVTLPRKRRIFGRRRIGIIARLPLAVLGVSISISLVMGMMLIGDDRHAGENISHLELVREKL